MDTMPKVVVVGAGPVGALAALYAAHHGYNVSLYELRNDLRDPSTVPLNFTRSINLALSERGIHAMRHVGEDKLIEQVLAMTIPMRGRMIHSKDHRNENVAKPQNYDIHGRTIFAIDRGALNKCLLDFLEQMPNVRFFFNHKLTGADFTRKTAWFEDRTKPLTAERYPEVEVNFDFMIGADGAHSAVRYHMMKFTRMEYHQEYIDTLWCEFQIGPREGQPGDPFSKFAMPPNYLHIWPAKEFMFIAIPSVDGSFTCTLFLPGAHFAALEDPSRLPAFFDEKFPGVTDYISHEELLAAFEKNPHLPLISIKCAPYHFSSSAVILGDAAHAMVPFYGQGMNAGLQDVEVLFATLDKHINEAIAGGYSEAQAVNDETIRAAAFAEYSSTRVPDGHAINDLALQNYVEMRAAVLSPLYRAHKFVDEMLSLYLPSLGWKSKYARVSFGTERYSDVVASSNRQSRLLGRAIGLLLGLPPAILTFSFLYNRFWKRR